MRVPTDLFSFRVEDSDADVRLRLTGRFDATALAALEGAIGHARGRDVVIDLAGLTVMDEAAWLAVIDWEHRVHGWGKDLRLVNVDERIRRIFELTASEHLLAEAGRG